MMRLPPFRDHLRRFFASGWGRLFFVVWVTVIAAAGYRYSGLSYIEEQINFRRDTYLRHLREYPDLAESSRAALNYWEEKWDSYEDAELNLILAIFAPPLLGLATLWVARGFKRRDELKSSTSRIEEDPRCPPGQEASRPRADPAPGDGPCPPEQRIAQRSTNLPGLEGSRSGASPLLNGALWIVGLMIAVGIGKFCGRESASQAFSALKQLPSTAGAEANEWTSTALAQLRQLADVQNRAAPFLVTAADRDQMANCVVAKFMVAMPGGPEEVRRSSAARISEVAQSVGSICGSEFSSRVTGSATWVPAFKPVFVAQCMNSKGESMKKFCECLADLAPKYFNSPAELASAGVDSGPSDAVDRRITMMQGACGG